MRKIKSIYLWDPTRQAIGTEIVARNSPGTKSKHILIILIFIDIIAFIVSLNTRHIYPTLPPLHYP